MQNFNILKNMNWLNNISSRLKDTIKYGLLCHLNEYLEELQDEDHYDYVVNTSLVFIGEPGEEYGYPIVHSMNEDDPTKIDSMYDDYLDGISVRLIIDTDGYVGIMVYNLDESNNIIPDDSFCLCIYDFNETTEDSNHCEHCHECDEVLDYDPSYRSGGLYS